MSDATVVLAGTTKGLFVLRSRGRGAPWDVEGPHLRGQEVDAVALEHREGRTRVHAGGNSSHWGPMVATSEDLGRTWAEETPVRFPEGTDAAVERVWQIAPLGDVTYVGVAPAALFASTPDGFALVRGLWDHPHRPRWDPGGGGLCLHTILRSPADPARLWVAISTGGVYRSDDGGATWQPRNRGIATPFLPGEQPPEFGQCVHKIALHPDRPDTLFLQHHWGVYRSDDGGDSWTDIGGALPSDFGFPIVADPHDADTVYVLPLTSDEFRCTPEGRCRVYRSSDGGGTWTALERGLPQDHAYLTVLRDGFTADPGAGLFFGTRTGEVYGSADGGESWSPAAEHLPPVLTVRAGVLD